MSYSVVEKWFVVTASCSSTVNAAAPDDPLELHNTDGSTVWDFDTESDALTAAQGILATAISNSNKQNGPLLEAAYVVHGYRIVHS